MHRPVKLAAIVAMAATLPAAALALAREDIEFKSTVTIGKAANGSYRGKVKSPNDRCQRSRLVKVFHDSNPRFLIGRKRTKDNGSWRLGGPEPPVGDKVYAVVTEDEYLISNVEKTVGVCKKDVSPKVKYPHGG